MTGDPRLTLANGRVADAALRGRVEARAYVAPEETQCIRPVADMLDRPGGTRVTQLLYGDPFAVIERTDGHAFGQCLRDGYVGYASEAALGTPAEPTHWVIAPSTHLYPHPQLQARAESALYLGSTVRVLAVRESYMRIHTGQFVPAAHLRPLGRRFDDPAGVAELYLGSPYLWGGGTRWGIDCSGLVQRALEACGTDCPRDTDMQEATLGRALDRGEPLRRGDLVFWKGHVGIMLDGSTLLHANARHMAVAREPVIEAIRRIEATPTGAVTCRRRL